MKKEYCCDDMKRLIQDDKSPLAYEPTRRLYSLVSDANSFKTKNEICIGFNICYCPKCGTKLPKALSNEWFKIVKKEFGIANGLDERIKDLPQEFKTDEWWKKRGL